MKQKNLILSAFENQVEQFPNSLAIVCGDQSITYRNLNQKVNALAHHIMELGCTKNSLIAVILPRSIDFIIAILAIIKSGGCYVPIDPNFPIERIKHIIKNAGVSLLIANTKLMQENIPLIDRNELDKITKHCEIHNPSVIQDEDDPMYVIYTSGSTGTPKGAINSHQGFVNLVQWYGTDFGMTNQDNILIYTALCFDLTQKNIFTPLMVGAKIVLYEDNPYDPKSIVQLIEKHQITWVNSTPSAFYPLVDEGRFRQLSSLRYVFLGGEPLFSKRLGILNQFYPKLKVVNTYGPTECADVCAFYCLQDKDFQSQEGCVPIGKATVNMQLHALNDKMEEVSVGEIGELYITGLGVGLGYLNNFELTAKTFLIHSLNKEPARVFYKTGDLVRYLPDFNIEFIERKDFQVKIRGYRIELDEISNVLKSYPHVKDALVLAHQNTVEDTRLLGYILEEKPLCVHELKKHLRNVLPAYMIPQALIVLDAFPLTLNGKIDRKSLPIPKFSENHANYVAPQTKMEELLCNVWQDVLKIERIGVHDDFFELGGHSLLATQIVSKLFNQHALSISLGTFFQNPTVFQQAQAIQSEDPSSQGMLALEPNANKDKTPLSFAQQRLWFVDQLLSQNSLYIIHLIIELKGPLAPTLLESALNQLIQRHDVLRTVFKKENEEPYQWVKPSLIMDIPIVDVSKLDKKEEKAKEWILKKIHEPFHLEQGPLLGASLIQLSSQQHYFILVIHHTIADGLSLNVITEELSKYYNAMKEGQEANLPALPIQYADYSWWQRQYLNELGFVYQKQLAYWKKALHEAPTAINLQTDFIRPNVQTHQGETQAFQISSAQTLALKELSQREGTTLYMTLLTCFFTLLFRYTGQEDMVLGSPIAGRHKQEIEKSIGFFVNTLALRARLTPFMSFKEFLQQMKDTTLGAYDNQDLPFEKLLSILEVERTLAYNPLFQVMFAFQNGEWGQMHLNGIEASNVHVDSSVAKFDLTLDLKEMDGSIQGYLEYSTDLFRHETIERMIGHFKTLMDNILNNPDLPLCRLEMLTVQEKHQLLVDWNNTSSKHSRKKTIQNLFEQQVEGSPHRIAMVFQDISLTYQELNEHANRLAHYLRKQGVGAETLIGFAFERSVEMVIGILGILKAGGAYVPLDPAYPRERLQYILEDANAPFLITQSHLQHCFDEYSDCLLTLAYDLHSRTFKLINEKAARQDQRLSSQPKCNPTPISDPQHLAYVMYTSGSTGKPKGVMIEQGALAHRLEVLKTEYGLEPSDSFVHCNSIGFDASIEEYILPLVSGARCYLFPAMCTLDPLKLLQFVSLHQITTFNGSPSLVENLLEAYSMLEYKAPIFKRMLIGGEQLSLSLLRKIMDTASLALNASHHENPSCKEGDGEVQTIWNMYGPTETTIDAIAFHCTNIPDYRTVPIGRPLCDVKVYILDPYLNPVPIGLSGEIYIGGAGLARGYWNKAELTREKFIPNPFLTPEEDSVCPLLYRTGDLARYLPDGNIEFIGRMDDQIKIRGFRVELGEIEATLLQLPEIKEVTLTCLDDSQGDKKLAAYVVLEDRLTSSFTKEQSFLSSTQEPCFVLSSVNLFSLIEHLKSQLARTLSDYMIPPFFIFLDKIPRTAHGKTDKKALPSPISLAQLTKQYVAPTTKLEHQLCEMWSDVLKIKPIGVDDNFFELGGHSLLATQVVSRIYQTHSLSISLKTFFQSPTIKKLANLLKKTEALPQRTSNLCPFRKQKKIPLSSSQQALWNADKLPSQQFIHHIPLYLELIGELNYTVLKQAIHSLMQRHESLRAVFESSQDDAFQTIQSSVTLDVPLIDLTLLNNKDNLARNCMQEEILRPFNLQQGPLIRVTLIKLEDLRHLFLLTIHHIISDGWSMGVIEKEISELYNAIQESRSPKLPMLPIQYTDAVLWQQESFNKAGDRYQKLLSYWKERLSGAPALFKFPTDYARPEKLSFKGGVHAFEMSPHLTQCLKKLSDKAGTTLYMTLLTVFYILLYRHSGEEDIVLGSPIAGRNRQEMEHLVGYFINILVLRATIKPSMSFSDLLTQIRDLTLESYDYQDLPLETLVEALSIEKNASYNPLFQIMFILHNTHENLALDLKGLKTKEVAYDYPIAKFDLLLAVTEKEGQLKGRVEYATDLFKSLTIEYLMTDYLNLLETIVKNQQQTLSNLCKI